MRRESLLGLCFPAKLYEVPCQVCCISGRSGSYWIGGIASGAVAGRVVGRKLDNGDLCSVVFPLLPS